jgi:hypothetical protein
VAEVAPHYLAAPMSRYPSPGLRELPTYPRGGVLPDTKARGLSEMEAPLMIDSTSTSGSVSKATTEVLMGVEAERVKLQSRLEG